LSLAQKLADLQAAERQQYILENHPDHPLVFQSTIQSRRAELRSHMQNADREFLNEREKHLKKMHLIYTERGEDANAYVTMRRREYLAEDLCRAGFSPRIIPHKNMVVTVLAEPDRADAVAKSIVSILDATPDTDLTTYEEQLDFFVTRIEKAKASDDTIMPIGEPL
jgi:hypothetical protein